MKPISVVVAAAAVALAGPAFAADPPPPIAPAVVAPVTVQNYVSGNFAAWGAVAVPTLYRISDYRGDVCTDDDAFFDWNQDWCRVGFGVGGDSRIHFGRGALGFQLETLAEFMRSMSVFGDGEAEQEEFPDPTLHGLHLAGGAHVIFRTGQSAFGAFGAVTYTHHMSDDGRPLHAMAGVEAAYIGAANTVYTQAGALFILSGEDAIGRMYFGRAGFRHFFGENAMIETAFAGGYAPIADVGDDDDRALWLQGALGIERGIGTGPLSLLAGYQADYYRVTDADDIASVLVHTFKIGFRLNFGGSLAEQNATGARTFTLPNLFAPIAYTGDMN